MVKAREPGLKTAQGRAKWVGTWESGLGYRGPRPAWRPSSPSREAHTLQMPLLCLLLRVSHLYLSVPSMWNSPVILDRISFCQIRQHLTLLILYFFGPCSMWNLNSLCVHLLSQVRLFVTPWTEDARFPYLLEFAQTMYIESLMLSDHLIFSHPFFLLLDQGSNLDPYFGSSES